MFVVPTDLGAWARYDSVTIRRRQGGLRRSEVVFSDLGLFPTHFR